MNKTAAPLALALMLALALCSEGQPSNPPAAPRVIFVCEHGSVKSLIAASHFNRLAEQRGLAVRAISRGVAPDEVVPPKIAAALAAEGFDLTSFKPTTLRAEEAAEASRVVSIGADLSALVGDRDVTLERWDEIPPASVDYNKAKEALLKRIEALLAELGRP